MKKLCSSALVIISGLFFSGSAFSTDTGFVEYAPNIFVKYMIDNFTDKESALLVLASTPRITDSIMISCDRIYLSTDRMIKKDPEFILRVDKNEVMKFPVRTYGDFDRGVVSKEFPDGYDSLLTQLLTGKKLVLRVEHEFTAGDVIIPLKGASKAVSAFQEYCAKF